ncbi:MAG: hypothetical protein LBC40_04010 [Dysgonamonadaceae bacterium]|jgi:acyl-ACP thioesterase|nr:hypothetical protein [Dysgonamonadaceae bacterium]
MYRLKTRVCASHTDARGRLKLVSAIDMMQDCSQMWWESEPKAEKFFKESNIAQMLVFRQAGIRRVPIYGEKLCTETRVWEMKPFMGYRNTVIYDEAGEPCIESWSIGVFVNLETGRPEKLPPEVLGSMKIDPRLEMEYLSKKIALPPCSAEKLPPVKVSRGDIDFNRHMNNARYVQTALELLPPGFEITRFRIEYKMPAKYGDLLYPEIISGGGNQYIVLNNVEENLKPWAIMEFCGEEKP